MVIGEVVYIDVFEKALSDDGVINYGVTDAVTTTGLDAYYKASPLTRLSYAKPDKPLSLIDFE